MSYYDQRQFDVRCDWGAQGLDGLAASDVVIVVDVLSFTTSVEIAVSRGVTVLPYPMGMDGAEEYAQERDAQLAAKRSMDPGRLTLSPSSLTQAPDGTKLVLPSPNGSSISFQAARSGAQVIAGCLRNASAVAAHAASIGGTVSVIQAGERWPDRSLRPALEDALGAGAIIRSLPGSKSPEAAASIAMFEDAETQLENRLQDCASGQELIERGFGKDVELAAKFNASQTIPVLKDEAFVNAGSR